MANQRKIVVATAAAGGLLAVGAASYAFADTQSPAPSPNSSSSSRPGPGTHDAPPQGEHGRPQHADKAVSSTIAAQVTAAIKAKDASTTIDGVRQEQNGSYDAFGQKSGKPVRYVVSKDLKTITLAPEQMGHGGPGGEHGRPGKAVNSTVSTSVKAAVTAKDSGVTVEGVSQRPDGSYDAFGTKDGKRVHFTVSKDLKTVALDTRTPEARGGRPDGPAPQGGPAQAPKGAPQPSGTHS